MNTAPPGSFESFMAAQRPKYFLAPLHADTPRHGGDGALSFRRTSHRKTVWSWGESAICENSIVKHFFVVEYHPVASRAGEPRIVSPFCGACRHCDDDAERLRQAPA